MLITDQEISDILKKVDTDGNDEIEYSEFLTHCLTSKHLSHDNVRSFFKIMTGDNGQTAGNIQGESFLTNTDFRDYFLMCGKVYK